MNASRIGLALIAASCFGCGTGQDSPRPGPAGRPAVVRHSPTDAEKAIEVAERFVRDNGYTDFRPSDDAKLVSESVVWSERDKWIDERHSTLRARAVGYFRGSARDPEGWTVGFGQANRDDEEVGRAVTMDAHLESVRIEHQDILLKSLSPRP